MRSPWLDIVIARDENSVRVLTLWLDSEETVFTTYFHGFNDTEIVKKIA